MSRYRVLIPLDGSRGAEHFVYLESTGELGVQLLSIAVVRPPEAS
jgi:hypothetical protein